MATKQELELQVIELSRQIKDLQDELLLLKSTDAGQASVSSQEDQKIYDLLREEISSLKENGALLEAAAADEHSKRLRAERLLNEEREAHAKRQDSAIASQIERTMLAHELLELVKYQYIPTDTPVAILKVG